MMFERGERPSLGAMLSRGAMAGALVLLCACQSTSRESRAADEEESLRDALQISDLAGMLQTAPDEFSVITKRPLEMPGSFAALPAPEPGKRSSRDLDPIAEARAALSLQPVPAATGRLPAPLAPSASEAAILSAAGPVDPNIRTTLASEQAAYDSEQNLYVLDRLFPTLREARGDVNPDTIDAEAERLRLLEAGVVAPRGGAVATVPPLTSAVPVVQAPAAPAPVVSAPVINAPAPAGSAELIYLP